MSSRDNVICDDLSRLLGEEPHDYARRKGFTAVAIEQVVRWYLEERTQSVALILPSDATDRVKSIMQHVEKRVVRTIPRDTFSPVVIV